MSDFSSILSSIGRKAAAPQQSSDRQASNAARGTLGVQTASSLAKPPPSSLKTAGLKRKSEEPEPSLDIKSKIARLEDRRPSKAATTMATSSRFQLSTKPAGSGQVPRAPERLPVDKSSPPDSRISAPKPAPRSNDNAATPDGRAPPPAKRSFASIMEKAKAAEEAAKAAGSSTIKHRAREKMSKRDRIRMIAEAKAEQKARRKGEVRDAYHRKVSALQSGAMGEGNRVTSTKTATRKPTQPLSYKGTMRKEPTGGASSRKRNAESHGKYGGYVSWSDMDEAEDDEEDDEQDYDSEGSSDMEGGFDDVEREELMSTRTARKEDQEHLEEEERHRREKLARKRKLMELAQKAKAKKTF